MTYVYFKSALIATLMATSSFASSVPHEEDERDRSTLARKPMLAGDFDALTPDVMGYVASYMPLAPLERAQELVRVCKFFHAYFVPHMFFSWTPKDSAIPTGGNFARSYASKVVTLDLSANSSFTDNHLQGFTNLRCLDLMSNNTVTNEAVMRLTNLRHLNLYTNNTVTDDALKNLTNLTHLNLYENNTVADDALKNLTNLTSLNLGWNTTVTDKGVKTLANLSSLNLYGNRTVTDDALQHLTKLTSLKLYRNTAVTSAGYAHLANLHIKWF